MSRVLLVEDEPAIADTLVYALETECFSVTHALTGSDALAAAAREAFDFAILDIGLYLATLTHALIGAPDACSVIGNPFHTGVDGTSCATFTWNATDARPPIYAQFMSSLEVSTHQQMVVSGTEGRLEIDKLSNPRHMRLVRGEEVEEMVTTAPGYGYTFQTQEVARCLRAGLAESPLVPWRATIEVAQMLDAWRAGIPAA